MPDIGRRSLPYGCSKPFERSLNSQLRQSLFFRVLWDAEGAEGRRVRREYLDRPYLTATSLELGITAPKKRLCPR